MMQVSHTAYPPKLTEVQKQLRDNARRVFWIDYNKRNKQAR